MSSPPSPALGQVSRTSMAIAAGSTVVEWYDFTVYLYLSTVLARVFFGGGAGALLTTLGSFAIAYLMRPAGAVLFAHVGDRFGRRRMMLLSVGIMAPAMLATALLPTRAQIGPAAGWLLLLLRCVTGLSVGGEYTGVVAYLLEGARPERRGLVTSCASAASEVGGLLAVGVSTLVVQALGPAELDAWGWRVPFLVGAALAGAIGLARSTLEESPDFQRQQASGTTPRNPLRHALLRSRAGVARGFAISALGSITYYVGITYTPAFLTTAGALDERAALGLSTVAAVAVIVVTPLTGALSDRLGRRPVLLALAGASALLPLTLFAFMASGSPVRALVGATVLAGVAGAVSAVGAVATAEQLPGEGRLSGLALGATAATAIFGGLTPYVAQLLVVRTRWPMAPGAMIAAVAVCVVPVLLTMGETAPGPGRRVRRTASITG